MTKRMIKDLKNADSEKLIEPIYQREISEGIIKMGGKVSPWITKYKTDGILDGEFNLDGKVHVFRLILEVKKDESFDKATERSKVLIQVLYYLKVMDNAGEKMPDIILVGDMNECFVVHSNYIVNYLYKRGINWNIAPSEAAKLNPDLVLKLTEDENLQGACHVHVIDKDFDFKEVLEEVKALSTGTKQKVVLTDRNIRKIFDYFTLRILKKKSDGSALYTPREQVEYFMKLVLESDNCYSHPKKRGIALLDGSEVKVEKDAFEAFQNYYEFEYNAEEKKEFTAIADRLIEESDRRFKGDFYTPSIWVDEAHRMLNQELGMDWKDEYVVWDCASGTKNLTRDYKFKELYSSTLENHDLEISKNYNKDNVAFQYDFLNDDVELFEELLKKKEQGYELSIKDFKGSKIYKNAPSLVESLLEDKNILFLINPPYATSASHGEKGKKGVNNTQVSIYMNKRNLGVATSQLFMQFFYRIKILSVLFNSQVLVSSFTPCSIINGTDFIKLHDFMNIKFTKGFLFQASNFADVSGNWGISFTMWNFDVNFNNDIVEKKEGIYKYCDLVIKDIEDSEIKNKGTKTLYVPEESNKFNNLVRGSIEGEATMDTVYLKNALEVHNGKSRKNAVVIDEKFLGGAMFGGNIVQHNNSYVSLFSSACTGGMGITINTDNFEYFIPIFAARRLITGEHSNWLNSKDDYIIPDLESKEYKLFKNDSLIYSLFSTASNQSSLRDVEYGNRRWCIKNEFFFMSKDEIKKLSLEHNNDVIYEDIEEFGEKERFVYEKIQEIGKDGFNNDAWEVYELACELVKESFKYRKLFAMDKPEYQIENWDCGWYQVKGLLKEYMPDRLKEFNEKYKALEDRMRPLVYSLGFLK